MRVRNKMRKIKSIFYNKNGKIVFFFFIRWGQMRGISERREIKNSKLSDLILLAERKPNVTKVESPR